MTTSQMAVAERPQTTKVASVGYAAKDSSGKMAEFKFERQEPREDEILFDVLYCGVCHSDLHQVKNDWKNTLYPCVPGHEVVGRVTKIGSKVSKFKVGEIIGVGCMIDSCQTCSSCKEDLEQYCTGPSGATMTYNGPMIPSGENTFGGYSTNLVVKENFGIHIPEHLDPSVAAPLLCAGITTYSPLRHWNVKPGDTVGIVGLGGLGHVAVQLAKAMEANVILFTTDKDKIQDGYRFGADEVIVSTDKDAMKQQEQRFDFILSTIPESHDYNPYIQCLKRDATLCMVGALEELKPVNHAQVAFHRRSVAGSLIGGIAETQEMIDFCAQQGVVPQVEVIPIQKINEAYSKMLKHDVPYRFVIDMASLKS